MAENRKICVLGGDGRQSAVAARLGRIYECAAWGIGNVPPCAVRCAGWRDAVRGADAVILPLPVTRGDGKLIGCDVGLGEICAEMSRGSVLCGGMIPKFTEELAKERGFGVFDYYGSEAVQIRNAVPTAEGVIAALINELPVTVAGMTAAVTGYGRCARTLAQKLLLLGADVYAAARSERDLAWAAADGCAAVDLADFLTYPPRCDAIVNTVPVRLFCEDVLSSLDGGTVIFDISSGCVGVDREAVKSLGIKLVPLPSLPGKTAPETAGAIIAEEIAKKLDKFFKEDGARR